MKYERTLAEIKRMKRDLTVKVRLSGSEMARLDGGEASARGRRRARSPNSSDGS